MNTKVPAHRRPAFARKPRPAFARKSREKVESEATLTRKCQAFLASVKAAGHPIWWYKTHGGGYAKAGIPDLCIVVGGRSLWVELKTATGKVQKIQLVRLAEIRAAGGVACICRSVDELREVVERLLVEQA